MNGIIRSLANPGKEKKLCPEVKNPVKTLTRPRYGEGVQYFRLKDGAHG